MCVLSGLAVGGFATYESRELLTPTIPTAVAASAFERELGVAEALGFVRERVATIRLQNQGGLDAYEEPIDLDAGECVALVVTTEGPHRLQRIGLGRTCAFGISGSGWDSLTQESSGLGGGGVVAHAQYCSEAREQLQLCVETRPSHYGPPEAPATATVGVARVRETTLGGRERLNRGLIVGR